MEPGWPERFGREDGVRAITDLRVVRRVQQARKVALHEHYIVDVQLGRNQHHARQIAVERHALDVADIERHLAAIERDPRAHRRTAGIADVERSLARIAEPPRGCVWLSTSLGDEPVISIRDDGRGIDWDAVRRRAETCGLPSTTFGDLERALFADGFSTKDVVTAISGRGVGMAVIAEVTKQLGGRIAVSSNVGQGTIFEFMFLE